MSFGSDAPLRRSASERIAADVQRRVGAGPRLTFAWAAVAVLAYIAAAVLRG